MKIFKIFVLLLLLTACNAPKVYYDYDEQVNFNHFQTYSIYPDLRTGLSQLDEERLLNSLKAALSKKGISETADPDFLVNIYSEEYREPSRNSIGVGVGGTGGNVGVGISGGIPLGGPETYLSLTFDIIDAQKDELIWQAVVESRFNKKASPEKRKAVFDKMVTKALEGYPPKR